MGALFGAGPEIEYEARLAILADHRITLWETIKSCRRTGSADANITDQVPNEFNSFFRRYPHISHVFFDGKMPYDTFRRMVLPTLEKRDIELTALPSTSPRNASFNFARKLEAWAEIKTALIAHSESEILKQMRDRSGTNP